MRLRCWDWKPYKKSGDYKNRGDVYIKSDFLLIHKQPHQFRYVKIHNRWEIKQTKSKLVLSWNNPRQFEAIFLSGYCFPGLKRDSANK